jgi:hypothetical protein
MDDDDPLKEHQHRNEDDDGQGGDGEPKSFLLLNELSDLLMLPKDLLMDRSIRQEVYFSTLMSKIFYVLIYFELHVSNLIENFMVSCFLGVPINRSSID